MEQDTDKVLNLLAETLKQVNVNSVKDIADNGLKVIHSIMDNSLLTAKDRAEIAVKRDEILKQCENLNDVCNNFK